ncbi:hypothetical protein KQI88_15295 [Alkaliphilus sp. MSJ-5]|uniref:Uncharacterized protein n=1 Tax=Alkaliphilus flagellatus TaxID=2841507 RepID=A0ABS6G5L4_9FIRM|nr:hypothetical protein [Alkaliphilus flagellatus]MBU5677783.1 hypothetical protein [Alkaliphilus flagellatus]
MWLEPKTDWNKDDYYNAKDLNRVENNTLELTKILKQELGINVELGPVITDRDYNSIEFVDSLNRIERNIEAIRLNLVTPVGYEDMREWSNQPTLQSFDFNDANRYERNLELLYKWTRLIKDSIIYCGTFNCGEEVI